ncbi:MAG TPA: hypothetical protein VI299_07055 [Polyangiales bacterium]
MKRESIQECVLAIYDRPRDFPECVVVRPWTFTPDGKLTPAQSVTTFNVSELGPRGAISAARTHCKRLGLTFLPRDAKDDPMLVESWRGRPNMLEATGTRRSL